METTQVAVSKLEALISDLATETRIAEYDCACRLRSGDVEGATREANRAKLFRDSMIKIMERVINDNCK